PGTIGPGHGSVRRPAGSPAHRLLYGTEAGPAAREWLPHRHLFVQAAALRQRGGLGTVKPVPLRLHTMLHRRLGRDRGRVWTIVRTHRRLVATQEEAAA